jgi:hypothetical protein
MKLVDGSRPSTNQRANGNVRRHAPSHDTHRPRDAASAGGKPDLTIDHFLPSCATCGRSLSETACDDYLARQVFDLPHAGAARRHRAPRASLPLRHLWRCAASRHGARIAAFVVYLANYQFVPEDRLASLMTDLFGVSLSRATIG